MRKRAMLCLITAIVFATYSVAGLPMSYAGTKAAVVEVKTGTLTGKITDMEETPLAGQTVKVLDAVGTVKYSATSNKKGEYSIKGLEVGTYTLIMAESQKVTLIVKDDSTNTLLNAMLPAKSQAYAAGQLGAPLIVAIVGGCVLVGVAAYGISSYDSDTHEAAPVIPLPVSP